MEGTYPIMHGDRSVGLAQVTRRGLYYIFSCRLQLTGKIICRLELTCGDQTENLGIPVPEGGTFVLNKTLPASRLKEGKPAFRVMPKHDSVQGEFIPINPEEPFAYLSRLKNAYLQYRDQQIGIVIRE